MTRILKNQTFSNETSTVVEDLDEVLVEDQDGALVVDGLGIDSNQRAGLVTGVLSTVALPIADAGQQGIERSPLVTGVVPITTLRSAG